MNYTSDNESCTPSVLTHAPELWGKTDHSAPVTCFLSEGFPLVCPVHHFWPVNIHASPQWD
jgi:hypothetical protein